MTRRYPLEPLFGLTCWTMTDVRDLAPCGGEEYRLRVEHGVTERIADRLAVAAGLHPHVVWPEMLDHAIADAAHRCEDCGARFVPTRAGHSFCSKRCSRNAWQRRRYHTDPGFAARRIENARSYYAQAGEYVRARERRRYHARKAAA